MSASTSLSNTKLSSVQAVSNSAAVPDTVLLPSAIVLLVSVCVPDMVATSTASAFTTQAHFGTRLILTSVSPPAPIILTSFPVAALLICIKFTALAAVRNSICSLLFSS